MTKARARSAHLDKDGRPLGTEECLLRLSRLKVWHPRTEELLARFAAFERLTRHALEGKHISVAGRPGVGKSQLLKKIRNAVLIREAQEAGLQIQGTAIQAPWGDWRPILRVKTPPKVKITSFAEAFLTALGDEDPTQGSEGQKTRRIKQKLGEQRARIVLIDEFQSLTDHRTEQFAYLAADWLKDILNEEETSHAGYPGFVHAAFFGTQTMSPLFLGNGQLARRSVGMFEFNPYDWVDPKERALFGRMLDRIDEMLPFPQASLADEKTRFHLHRATDAVISRVTTLLSGAGLKAIDLGEPAITPTMLEQTFDELRWELGSADFRPRTNPWRHPSHDPGFMMAPETETTRKTRKRGKARDETPDFRRAA